MQIKTSHMVFAAVLIGWGILGLVKGDFAPGWLPVPETMPARLALVYLCSFVCIATGVGLFWRRTAVLAARVLFTYLLLWLLLLRLPMMVVSFGVGTWWATSSAAMIVASSWILYASLANSKEGFFAGASGVSIARVLFGLGLIPIGLAHFLYVENTAPLVPAWLLWPVFWAYFTGGAFIAAGLGVITGVFARLAATLVTLQIAFFTLLIWIPMVLQGKLNAFQWGEFEFSIVLIAGCWVVAGSYYDAPWFSMRRRDKRETQ